MKTAILASGLAFPDWSGWVLLTLFALVAIGLGLAIFKTVKMVVKDSTFHDDAYNRKLLTASNGYKSLGADHKFHY